MSPLILYWNIPSLPSSLLKPGNPLWGETRVQFILCFPSSEDFARSNSAFGGKWSDGRKNWQDPNQNFVLRSNRGLIHQAMLQSPSDPFVHLNQLRNWKPARKSKSITMEQNTIEQNRKQNVSHLVKIKIALWYFVFSSLCVLGLVWHVFTLKGVCPIKNWP